MKLGMTLGLTALLAASAWAQGEPPLVAEARWGELPTVAAPVVDLSARPQVSIPELPSAPALDGDLGDEAWRSALATGPWRTNTGEAPAPVPTSAWLGVHGGRLYVGVRADEPNVAGIVAQVAADGGPTWNDDCIELFLDSELALRNTRQLVINSRGAVTTLRHGGGDWRPTVARAARVGDDAWFVEMALPLAELGLTGADFGINLCRERRAGGGLELSCWSPTGGAFNEPSRFVVASVPGSWLRGFAVGAGTLGRNTVTATVANPEDAPRRVSVRLTWWQGEGLALERSVGPFALEPGEERAVSVGYEIGATGTPVQLELTVLDDAGRPLTSRETTQEVASVLAMEAGRSVLLAGERTMFAGARLTAGPELLAQSRLVVALFREPGTTLMARTELTPPRAPVLRARLALPPLAPGRYSLQIILKDARGERRIAEEKAAIHVLAPVP